jgi:hypothetical protein
MNCKYDASFTNLMPILLRASSEFVQDVNVSIFHYDFVPF